MANETITLGGGCFWCLEAVYLCMDGVTGVQSGYAGGQKPNPTYKEVCRGNTGHAEVVRVEFEPEVTPMREILSVFFTIHDPTTLNRQGADVGTQYRSVIFYYDDAQKVEAESIMRELTSQQIWPNPLVTHLEPMPEFYVAEDYHQEYYFTNPHQGYCMAVVAPKVSKFRSKFAHKLKADREEATW